MTTNNLLVELLVEELPPKALEVLGEAFARTLARGLMEQGLVADQADYTMYASPRRLAVLVPAVAERALDRVQSQKLMPVGVGLGPDGQATPALLKKLQALGADASAVSRLRHGPDGKTQALFFDSTVKGTSVAEGLQKALQDAIARLPIPKLMSYQLEADCELPGWSSVSFVRPAHRLIALHGSTVVPVQLLGLRSGNSTLGHRFEAAVAPLVIKHADDYAATLERDGAVIASFVERRSEIVRQLARACERLGGGVSVVQDAALLDEVTALVERPNVLVCSFEPEFLEVPQECLILTMKANQKYFPLLDGDGKLTNRFLVVSNIRPADPREVIGGNERVVRPRLADAKFFFDQDRRTPLAARVAGLGKVVYHNKLGTQGERVLRVRALAGAIGAQLGGDTLAASARTAAGLAKADLLTDMVGEFPELQGIMGGYYARHDGLDEDTAIAIEDHYKPRFAGDALPRNPVAIVVALADKLETLAGMFGIGNAPTGDKDPYALRRHALGVIRMLTERDLPLELGCLLSMACEVFADEKLQREAWAMEQEIALERDPAASVAPGRPGFTARALDDATLAKLSVFIYERLAGALREQGYSAQETDAVVSKRPQYLGAVPRRLAAVRAFLVLPEAPALAAANKRIGNILKKAPEVDPHVSQLLLREPAEIALHEAMQEIAPLARARFDAGDYTASLRTLAALRAPVDAFFDQVMVNADELDLRLNRQGLLQTLHNAMNQVADLSRLAS